MDIYSHTLRAEYKPNCYVLISFERDETAFKEGDIRAKPIISFLYDAGDIAAEWCPPYGPFQIWRRGKEGVKYLKPTLAPGAKPEHIDAQPHYAYPLIIPALAEWSQPSVERHQLAVYAIDGHYDYIFNVLKDWAVSR